MDTIALKKVLLQVELKQSIVILLASVILPFLVHLFPSVGGLPLGARLLPMFYAPLIAVILLRPRVAIITALFSPILNCLLTGHPAWEKVLLLTVELEVFSIAAYLIQRRWKKFWGAAGLAYLLAAFSANLWYGISKHQIPLKIAPRLLPKAIFLLSGSINLFFAVIVNALAGLFILILMNKFLLTLRAQ